MMTAKRAIVLSLVTSTAIVGCATADRGSPEGMSSASRPRAADVRADAYAYYSEAQMRAQSGEFKEAIAAMQEAIKTDPNSAYLWTTLAQWYGRVDQPTEALAAARRAVQLAP